MSNIILVNPAYHKDIFVNSKVRSAISHGATPLGLVSLAAPLLKAGHRVKIVDLNISRRPDLSLVNSIKEFKPQFIGITSTTPLIRKVYRIAEMIKSIDKDIVVIAGGPNPSALAEEVLHESQIDCVAKGEGDIVFKSIIEKGMDESIPNLFYKRNDEVVSSFAQDNCIDDLDALPFPSYEILDVKKYRQPKISSRRTPTGYIETSRGCFGRCIFCNKNIHGYKVRMKSPKRVVDEMERMLSLGFRELHVIDDIFTADADRAFSICEEILKRGLKFSWCPRGGVRVDCINLELLKIMKRSGCYRVPFGVESGSQRVIGIVNKGITLRQAEEAVSLAKKAGLEAECYFMLGLPGETEQDLNETIKFAVRLNPDYVKFAISVPFPGTQMFDMMFKKGQIRTKDWNKYNFSTPPDEIFDHDIMPTGVITRYYGIAFRRYYFRPGYVSYMLLKTVMDGTFFAHAKAFLKTKW